MRPFSRPSRAVFRAPPAVSRAVYLAPLAGFRAVFQAPIAFVACVAAGLAFSTAASAQVFRCEGADGRVTYTNEPCPSTARRSRTVDDSPPVQAPRSKVEKAAVKPADEAPAKAESSEAAKPEPAKDVAKDAGKDVPKDGKPAVATTAGATPSQIRTANAASNLSAAQQMEQLDLERARQQRACDQLERRLSFARSDADGASGGQRASAELQLRRLQEDFLVQCPMQR
jgi:type IV secretory pathway VirB10-like protein